MSYQQEEVPDAHPSKQQEKKFFGWKFGGNLTEPQAEQLEPMVDVMTEMLQQALFLPADWLLEKSQHEIALAITHGAGMAAGTINDISFALISEKNEEEKTLLLNQKATGLRQHWMTVAVMAVLAVINLDKTLKGDEPDADNKEV